MLHNLWAIPADMAESILRELHSDKENGINAAAPMQERTSTHLYALQNSTAIISIALPIMRTDVYAWNGRLVAIGQDSIRESLTAAFADAAVSSILLIINSPGGVVHGTKELADFITASPKPMAAYVDGLCASAAFWLAASCGRIFCPVTGMVGSVGVIQMHADYSGLYEKIGIKFTPITAGTYKAVGSDSKPLSDDDFAYLQRHLTQIHSIFKDDVKSGLALSAPESAWGEAQMFLAGEAKDLGLVHAIVQDVHEAIQLLNKESIMDEQTLAAQHPELLAKIQSDAAQKAVEEAKAEAKATFEAKQGQGAKALLAVVAACVGEKAMASITTTLEKCQEANLTDAQIIALAPTMASAAKPEESEADKKTEQSTEQSAMQAVLKGLQSATPDPLAADPKNMPSAQGKSALVQDAENRAKKEKV